MHKGTLSAMRVATYIRSRPFICYHIMCKVLSEKSFVVIQCENVMHENFTFTVLTLGEESDKCSIGLYKMITSVKGLP